MYRVIYGDSDSRSTSYVQKTIDWQRAGFQLSGVCSNGYEIMELAEKVYPDLVVMDIDMPFISGLDAARQIRSNYPHVQVIFYTECTRFQAAKAALDLQVLSYVLKTEPLNALYNGIRRAKEVLDQQRDQVSRLCALESCYQQNRKLLLGDLIQGTCDAQQIYQRSRALHVNWTESTEFMLAVLDLDNYERQYWNQGDTAAMRYALYNIASEMLQDRDLGMAWIRERDVVLLCWEDRHPGFSARFQAVIQEILKIVTDKLGFGVSASVSQVLTGCGGIPAAVRETAEALRLQTREPQPLTAEGGYSQLVHRAIRYIEASYMNQDLSAKSVCERLHISPSYFRTLFKRQTGSTIIGYITKVRMERAQALLADRSLKTSEIAEKIGYQDAHYFNYCYRKYFGVSITESRESK